MYKVFVNEKPVVICNDPDCVGNKQDMNAVMVHSRSSIEAAYIDFTRSSEPAGLILYNNENADKLFSHFISLFRYLEAAGGVVQNLSGERLFIYRFGKWDLPKGKIEKSETPSAAALREVTEETGLHGQSILCELPSTWHIYQHQQKKILKRTYWFAMKYSGNEQPVPQLEEEITKAAWFPASANEFILANTYASLHDLIVHDSLPVK